MRRRVAPPACAYLGADVVHVRAEHPVQDRGQLTLEHGWGGGGAKSLLADEHPPVLFSFCVWRTQASLSLASTTCVTPPVSYCAASRSPRVCDEKKKPLAGVLRARVCCAACDEK